MAGAFNTWTKCGAAVGRVFEAVGWRETLPGDDNDDCPGPWRVYTRGGEITPQAGNGRLRLLSATGLSCKPGRCNEWPVILVYCAKPLLHMKTILLYCLPLVLLTSCVTRAVYQSPMHTNTNRYKPVPLHNEGTAAASYAGFHATVGSANQHGQDQSFSFGTSFHRSHNFNVFQATYGANLELGDYKVNRYHLLNDTLGAAWQNRSFDAAGINERAGHKFFGAYGLNGSINVVLPFRRSEWRVLGIEAAWNREFGNYLDFRKNMPTGIATMVDRKNNYFVWGFFTEILGRVGHGDNSLGYKLALYGTTRTIDHEWIPPSPEYIRSAFFAQTFHFTVDNKVTIALQTNFGTYASSASLSSIVRLDNLRKKKAGSVAGL